MKKNSTTLPFRVVRTMCRSNWYRRILLMSGFFFFLVHISLSQPVLLTQASDHGGGTTTSLDKAPAFKEGKIIVASLFNKTSGISVTAPSGWNLIRKTDGDGMTLHTFYASYVPGLSFNFKYSKAGPWSLAVVQFDGLTQCSLIDVSSDNMASDAKTFSSSVTSTTEDNELILSIFAKNESKNFSVSATPNTTINEIFQSPIPGYFSYHIGTFYQSKAGRIPTVNVSTKQGQGSNWINQMIALKPVSTLTGSPLVFKLSISNDGKICENAATDGLDIQLSGTQSNITYQLKKDGIAVGAAITGNGNPYTFKNIQEPGTYTVTAFNPLSSCSIDMMNAVTLSISPRPVVKITTDPQKVLDCNVSMIKLTASGGVSYIWNNGATTSSINVTAIGVYAVTALSSAGCISLPANIEIKEDKNISASIVPPSTTVLNYNNPAIVLQATGGANYVWNTGANSASITVTAAGIYSVTVTGANGCSATAGPVTITEDKKVEVDIKPSGGSGTDGTVLTCLKPSIVLTASGGVQYIWNTGSTASSITVTAAGTYSVMVTTSNGGMASKSIKITEDKQVMVTVSGITTICSGSSTVLTAAGGIAYSWNNGQSYTESIKISSSGDYTVEVTGSNGCVVSKTTTVTEIPNPASFTLTSDNIKDGLVNYCPGTGGAELKLSGSQLNVSYALYRGINTLVKTLNGTGSGISFGNQTGGTYNVIATFQGCTTNMKGTVETKEVTFPDYGSMVPATINLLRWQTTNIMAAPVGGNWTSRNPEIVTVNNEGLVTAVNVGSSFIDLQVNKQGCTYNLAVAVNVDANLPVSFIDISAKNKDGDVLVEWILGSEADIIRYEVERSSNGVDFEKIGEVASKGNSSFTVNYDYLDRKPMEGMNYYRIRSVGRDVNDVEYSKVVWINMMSSKKNIALYPNPVIDNVIRMVWTNLPKGDYEVILMDMKGAKLLTKTIQYNGRYAYVELDVSFRFQKGYYNIQILRKREGEVPEVLQVFKF